MKYCISPHLTRSSAFEIITSKEHGKNTPKKKAQIQAQGEEIIQF
jgi:hypothetical protein